MQTISIVVEILPLDVLEAPGAAIVSESIKQERWAVTEQRSKSLARDIGGRRGPRETNRNSENTG